MDEKHITCPLCLELASTPRQTDCCYHLFCLACIQTQERCPICRTDDLTFSENVLVTRILDCMPAVCTYGCGITITRGNMKSHSRICDQRMINCPVPKCTDVASMNRALFLAHMVDQHAMETIDAVTSYVPNESQQHGQMSSKDVIAIRRNHRGITARLGITGKYYCAQRILNGGNGCCQRCDGYCGPSNGCNCLSCMRLDVEIRGLPKGYLVNRDGYAARKSEESFYCGRLFARYPSDPDSHDGYCGPTNGPSCHACSVLDLQAETLYASLMV